MSSASGSKLMVSATEYFHEKVGMALQNQNVQLQEDLQFYLVNLLCDFIDPSKFIMDEATQTNILNVPLAMIYKEALEAPLERKMRIFKRLGDTSLYISGFFQDYFNRKAFDIEYFMTLGEVAYNNMSTLSRGTHNEENFSEVYRSLAAKFPVLVEVVAEVSDMGASTQPSNILAIYDRWTKTQSDRLRRVLETNGIHPIPMNMKQAQ